jgi:hypothetical protein
VVSTGGLTASTTSVYMSAKAMSSAAGILSQHLKNPVEGAKCFKRASELFLENGNADRAVEEMEKAAR